MKKKSSPEYEAFDAAMDSILKADPVKVKAEMAADKQARSKKRLKKGAIFVRERGQSPVVAAFNEALKGERRGRVN